MAGFRDLCREIRDIIYGLLFHNYHVSATIQSVDPTIIYAYTLTQIRAEADHNLKENIIMLTMVSRLVQQEALEVLFSRLVELRFDRSPRSTLSIPTKHLRNAKVVRGMATGPSGLSLLPLPSLKKVILYRPDIHISSPILFDSFWYSKGSVQRSWAIELKHFCFPDSLIYEVCNDKDRKYDVLYHCDVVLEGRWCGASFRSAKRTVSDHNHAQIYG